MISCLLTFNKHQPMQKMFLSIENFNLKISLLDRDLNKIMIITTITITKMITLVQIITIKISHWNEVYLKIMMCFFSPWEDF